VLSLDTDNNNKKEGGKLVIFVTARGGAFLLAE
jgi:hypothetical protein